MVERMKTWIAGATSLFAVATLGAAEFTPNNIFVVSYATSEVIEFDPSGAIVRQIPLAAAGCPNPIGLAFSPRGTLFLVSSSQRRVIEIDADGNMLLQITLDPATTGAPSDLAFGPEGHLYIGMDSFKGVEVRTIDGIYVDTITHPSSLSTASIAHGADGALWTVGDGHETILRWSFPDQEPAAFLVSFLSDNSTGGACFDGRGRLHALFDESIHVYDGRMNKLGEYATDIDSPFELDLTIGPNGNGFMTLAASGVEVIREYEFGAFPSKIRDIALNALTTGDYQRIAFAPFRFKIEVKGPATSADGTQNLKEKGASLTYFPGSGRVFMQFDDALLNPNDYSSLFSATTLAFQGFEQEKTENSLRLGATHQPWGANTIGLASLVLDVQGKTDESTGFFSPKSANGTLHRAGAVGVFTATVKTKKLLK
jgi:hypothetical protein